MILFLTFTLVALNKTIAKHVIYQVSTQAKSKQTNFIGGQLDPTKNIITQIHLCRVSLQLKASSQSQKS